MTTEVAVKSWLQDREETLLRSATTLAMIRPLIDNGKNEVYVAEQNGGIFAWPSACNALEGAAIMRRVFGALQKAGWKMEHTKEKDYEGNEGIKVTATKGEYHVRLEGWMAKSCRIVEETVTVPAKPATPAQPERTEVRRRIVCKND